MTARRPRQALHAIIAGLLGVAVSGCSAAGPPTASGPVTGTATSGPTSVTDSPAPTAPETGTPPTTPETAAPTASSTSLPAWPACRRSQLALQLQRWSEATGEDASDIALTNISANGCIIDGYPQVTMRDAAGHVLRWPVVHHGQYVTSNPPAPVAIPPGAQAYALVAKYRCDLGQSDDATTITVVLPHTTTSTTLALRQDPPQFSWCTGQANDPGNVLEVSPVVAQGPDLVRY